MYRIWFLLFGLPFVIGAQQRPALPLFFVANNGQAPKSVRFLSLGSGLKIHVSDDGPDFITPNRTIRARFPGSKPKPVFSTDRLPASVNFMIGHAATWRLGSPAFGKVVYQELYPGIDMSYGASNGRFKSEFVVHAGADYSQIRMQYLGADSVRMDPSGALVVRVKDGEMRESAPETYQELNGIRQAVESRYVLGPDGEVTFRIGLYDNSVPLIIDPLISYSVLLGGGGDDSASGVAIGGAGEIYVTGYTTSYDFPSVNPAQGSLSGSTDVFVAKLNATGTLVYCTFLGGSGDDRSSDIAVDASGIAYITGYTTSADFPTRNPIQSRRNGYKNAFVVKLSAAGSTLLFSTYLGGSVSDAGNGIAVDTAGNSYVVGDTTSSDFPSHGFQPTSQGGQDVFIAALNASGTALIYSTFLGGSSVDHGAAIAVDRQGQASVTGSTYSVDFPVARAIQPYKSGGQDAFVSRLSADGRMLAFSTFFGGSAGGGSSPETGVGIAVDADGNTYVAGITSSADFPTQGPLQSALKGSLDSFVLKISALDLLAYSTFLGGAGPDYATGIAVTSSGMVCVAGYTYSTDFPVTQNAAQGRNAGMYDAFVVQLAATGGSLLYGTYIGGSGSDTATSVAMTESGSLIALAGQTLSPDFPVSRTGRNGDNYAAFVIQMVTGGPPAVVSASPSSGAGFSAQLQIVVNLPTGASNIGVVYIGVNNAIAMARACFVAVYPAISSVSLANDAATGWMGSSTLGAGTPQSNSQCTVNEAGGAIAINGSQLTITLPLKFTSAFAGTKNIYVDAADRTGQDSGWQTMGSWSVPGGPTIGAVSPSSGSGSTAQLQITVNNSAGAGNLNVVYVAVNHTLSTMARACFIAVYPGNSTVSLVNDGATAWMGSSKLGAAGAAESNSQCTVNAAMGALVMNGNQLVITLPLAFTTAFAGPKNLYVDAIDRTGQDTGWQTMGTWSVAGVPTIGAVYPTTGNGVSATLQITVNSPSGAGNVNVVYVSVNNTLSTMAQACFVAVYPGNSTATLVNDAATGWTGSSALGATGTAQSNSQCTVNAAAGAVVMNGGLLTITLPLTFTSAFAGTKNLYVDAVDRAGQDTGWQTMGTWSVPGGSTIAAVSPSSGSGLSARLQITINNVAGAGNVNIVYVAVNNTLSTMSRACFVAVYPGSSSVSLVNDASTGWTGSSRLGAGGAAQSNSQCTVNAATGATAINGSQLTITLPLTFTSAFAGTKNVYVDAIDRTGQDTGWQTMGSWSVR